jgi:hypothetical protein
MSLSINFLRTRQIDTWKICLYEGAYRIRFLPSQVNPRQDKFLPCDKPLSLETSSGLEQSAQGEFTTVKRLFGLALSLRPENSALDKFSALENHFYC